MALDPLTRTPRLAGMPFRKAMSAAQGCHLYFARKVTFLSCADTKPLWNVPPPSQSPVRLGRLDHDRPLVDMVRPVAIGDLRASHDVVLHVLEPGRLDDADHH